MKVLKQCVMLHIIMQICPMMYELSDNFLTLFYLLNVISSYHFIIHKLYSLTT